ncbi:hypothetical protein MKW98_001491 [Papaver atlanticum]|uniref:PGG domain-containing protein n=1 Tax=Papaver atlanticum TaxID=357466 RepID=A0AAD4XM61_9MAGN|nr:hypothetical protein MKW98_001491 [Papaver atlanticum]
MSAREQGQPRDAHGPQLQDMVLGPMVIESLGRLEALLQVLVESQAKLAVSQENTQQQLIEILRNNNYRNGEKEHKVVQNKSSSSDHNRQQVIPITYKQKKKLKYSNKKLKCLEDDDQEAIFYPDGRNEELKHAAWEHNWESIKFFLDKNPEAITHAITNDSTTIIHSAMSLPYNKIMVEETVKLMPPKALAYKTSDNGFTALHMAAKNGFTKAAVLMVCKNHKLTQIRDKKGMVPLEVALHHVTSGQKEIVRYLYSVTQDALDETGPFSGHDGARLLCSAIDANFYGLALCLVKRFPKLILEISLVHGMCGLELLVRRPFAFKSGAKMTWWERYIYPLIQVEEEYFTYDAYLILDEDRLSECSEGTKAFIKNINSEACNPQERSKDTKEEESSQISSNSIMTYLSRVPRFKQLHNKKVMHETAVELMSHIFLAFADTTEDKLELIGFLNRNPNIINAYMIHEQNMLEMAITERDQMIVSFICEIGDMYDNKADLVSRTDSDNNTILHYVAKLAPSSQLNLVSGVALQMQRELQWFKGVESIMSENDKLKRNKDGDTAQSIFTEQHKELREKGEAWMKDTSGSCMVVSALVATVAFAAAFTVPGGNIGDSNSTKNGTPVFLGKTSFTMFAVADAISLFSSITSVLMFLAIYTSRYAEMDFLKSLPQKLIIGLATLFISMAAILVAFGASLYIVVGDRFERAPIPIALFSCCPLVLFAWLQLPLFVEMVRSTYRGSLFKEHIYTHPTFDEDNKEVKNSIRKENTINQVRRLFRSFWS